MLYLFFFFLPLFAFGEEVPIIEEQTSRFTYEFIKMFVILGGMVAVLLAISWYMKRLTNKKFERGNDESLIKVVERRSLSARSIVYLLDVEGKSFVIGETPHGLVKLGEYHQEVS